MPRRTHRRATYRRPTRDPAEKPPTYDQMAYQLVKAGRASPRILGALHGRVDITQIPGDHDTPDHDRSDAATRMEGVRAPADLAVAPVVHPTDPEED